MNSIRIALISAMLAMTGCTSAGTGPYSPKLENERRPVEADELSRKGAALVFTDPPAAEALLREALTLDLYCGPAHNNLGVLFLNRGELYEAAQEFEWARKLMPDAVDPRVNLGITLGLAGQHDEATKSFEAALEVSAGSINAMQGLAKALLESGNEADPRLSGLLGTIALQGTTAQWRAWAREWSLPQS